MKFGELPIGAQFRFFARGLLHAKVTSTSYEPVTGGSPSVASPDVEVRIEDRLTERGDVSAVPKAKSAEQQAREMLERIGVPNVKKISSAALIELAALIEKKSK